MYSGCGCCMKIMVSMSKKMGTLQKAERWKRKLQEKIVQSQGRGQANCFLTKYSPTPLAEVGFVQKKSLYGKQVVQSIISL